MERTSLNISLPESMRAYIESKVQSGDYGTASEYIRELIRTAQKEESKQKVEALLLEGLESEASELTPEDWDELKRKVRERQTGRRNER
jgi:antitoxin ParD1/3/4